MSNKDLPEVFSVIKAFFYSNNSNIQNGMKPLDNVVSVGVFRINTSYVRKEKLLNMPFGNSYRALWILHENISELTVN